MKRATTPTPPRIALALAGGGSLGAIYEIGALCALQESLPGINFTQLQHCAGVSAGGFIAAGLANGITPQQLFSLFIEDRKKQTEAFDPACLLTPALSEFFTRSLRLPTLLAAGAWHGGFGGQSLMRALERLSPSLPTGIFSSRQIDTELTRLFARTGRTNDFRQLGDAEMPNIPFLAALAGALRRCDSLVWHSHTALAAPGTASRQRSP